MDGLVYSDSFKLGIAIDILKENQSLVKIANKYNLEPFLIKRWKLQFIELVESTIRSKNLEIKYLKNQLNKQPNYDNLSNKILLLLK